MTTETMFYLIASISLLMCICMTIHACWIAYKTDKKRKATWQKIQKHADEYDFYMDGLKHKGIHFIALNIRDWRVEINDDLHEVYLNKKT